MKKFLKICLITLLLSVLCAGAFTACGSWTPGDYDSSKFADLFKVQPAEADNLVKNAKVLDFGTGTRLETFTTDDFAIYSKAEGSETRYYVYDLKKEQTVPNIYSTDYYGYYINVYSENFIAVSRSFDGVNKTAVYNKSGAILIDFSETFSVSDVHVLGSGILVIKSAVYKVTGTTIKKIMSGMNFNNMNVSMLGEEIIVVGSSSYYSGTYLYFDLDGKLLYTHQRTYSSEGGTSEFYVLSAKRGLLMTAYILPLDAKNYTFSEMMLKFKLKYEIVDFATGKKKEVKLNYIIDDVEPVFSLNKEEKKGFQERVLNYAFLSAYEITEDKVVSRIPVTLVTDDSLKVICAAENFEFLGKLTENRYLVCNGGFYQIADKNGNVVFNLGTSYQTVTANFVRIGGYYYNSDIYNLNGEQVINGSAYYDFYGTNYGKYFAARTDYSSWTILDYEGNSRKLEYDGAVNVYNGFYTVAVSGGTTFYNFAGTKLLDWSNSGGSIYYYNSGDSSVNSVYYAIQSGYTNTNKVLKLSV